MSATNLNSPLLADALIVLGAAGIVIPLFARLRITPVIGFILVGLLVGPSGLGGLAGAFPLLSHVSISSTETLQPFADAGIILLLFSIGLELSFARLWTMRRQVFGLGALELILIAAALTAVFTAGGEGLGGSLALGLALAMSSTALVLRITDTRAPVGRAALAMLLFEDLALVPIIFLLGALAPVAGGGGLGGMMQTLWLSLLSIVGLLLAGRFVLPLLFAQAARTKSPELFMAITLLAVIAAALVTAAAGLSPIVGALLAGLLIAETEYQSEVHSIIAPFKGLALGVFLIIVGMSLDLGLLWQQMGRVLLAGFAVLLLKAVVTGLLLRFMGARRGMATEVGILMAGPSETTLIVLGAAAVAQLISRESMQFWQMVTALGMILTPLLALLGRFLGKRLDGSSVAAADLGDMPPQHAIIVGFGRVGELVADMLMAHKKAFVAIDADTDLVAKGRSKGYPVTFGNAAYGDVLTRMGIDQATAIILTMDDRVAVQHLTRRLRAEHPNLPIIARARDAGHAAALYRLGASEAVPETLESSLQLSEAVLVNLGVPMGFVIASIHEKRDEFRAQIMEEGDLDEMPKLKSSRLRDRS